MEDLPPLTDIEAFKYTKSIAEKIYSVAHDFDTDSMVNCFFSWQGAITSIATIINCKKSLTNVEEIKIELCKARGGYYHELIQMQQFNELTKREAEYNLNVHREFLLKYNIEI